MKLYDITKEKIIEVQKYTNSAAETARELGIPFSTYRRYAKNFGVYKTNQGLKDGHKVKSTDKDMRKYSCNDFIFDILNPQVAYWLGFITADGYVYEKRNKLVIVLKEEDILQLENFKEFLNFTGPIFHRKREVKGIEYPIVEITITSKHIIETLVNKYKIFANKTYMDIKTFQYISQEYKKYFYMGFFDGDGSISSLDGYCFLTSKSNSILIDLQIFLKEKYNIESKITYSMKKEVYNWKITNSLNVYLFLKLYLSVSFEIPLLNRKVERAKKYFKYNGLG